METELEKIDIIRSRYRVSYEEARKALADASGDVVAALVALEKEHSSCGDLLALGAEVADEIQKMTAGGPVKRLRIKYGNRTIKETPVALTAAAALVVSLGAVLISRLAIELDKDVEETAE